MTENNDPFASPSSPQPATQPPAQQPQTPPPGMVSQPGLVTPQGGPGAPPPAPYAATPPPLGAGPAGWIPDPPRQLALWATVLTGLFTAMTLLSAVLAPQTVETLKDTLEGALDGTATGVTGIDAVGTLTQFAGIASFILLALWMNKVRSNRKARGEDVTGPPAVEFWGWFIPLANYVLPFLGMRGITRGRVGLGVLLGWWLPFCAYWVVGFFAQLPLFGAIDFTTGELTDTDALDVIVPLTWAQAVLLAVSWVFLFLIIRTATAKDDQPVH